MIAGTGIDIVEIRRMHDAIRAYGDAFLARIFTPREVAYARARRRAPQHFAARFAAKEAVVKAFGEPTKHPIRWTDIEVLNDAEGKPCIVCHETALRAKKIKRISDIMVSISHSDHYAVANAILIRGKGRKR